MKYRLVYLGNKTWSLRRPLQEHDDCIFMGTPGTAMSVALKIIGFLHHAGHGHVGRAQDHRVSASQGIPLTDIIVERMSVKGRKIMYWKRERAAIASATRHHKAKILALTQIINVVARSNVGS